MPGSSIARAPVMMPLAMMATQMFGARANTTAMPATRNDTLARKPRMRLTVFSPRNMLGAVSLRKPA